MTIDRRHLLGASAGLVTAAGLDRFSLTPAFAQSAPAYKPEEGKAVFAQQIFIELYNYGPAWAKCPENERRDFIKKIIEAVTAMKAAGIDVVAYGENAPWKRIVVHRTISSASIGYQMLSFSAKPSAGLLHLVGTTISSR